MTTRRPTIFQWAQLSGRSSVSSRYLIVPAPPGAGRAVRSGFSQRENSPLLKQPRRNGTAPQLSSGPRPVLLPKVFGSIFVVGMGPRPIIFRSDRGFSMVELLTVSAIIGVLAGLALPALASAMNRARSVQCLNQLRQLGFGLKLYADADPAGRLPVVNNDLPPIVGRSVDSWVMTLTNQLPTSAALRICPADAAKRQRKRVGELSSSYLLNTCLDHILGSDGTPLVLAAGCPSLDQLPSPAASFITFEASLAGYQAGEDRVHPETWLLGWPHVKADIDPVRHGRGANYLFGDGHVQSVSAVELQGRIERGDNFAVPPP